MDHTQQSINLASAYLWIGAHEHLVEHTHAFLRHHLCAHHTCGICFDCRAIIEHKQHRIVWLTPGNRYNLEDLEIVFEKLAYTQTGAAPFFFIFPFADRLTPACANRLLKAVEEPPAGYTFIFLSTQKNKIIPTIQSRCITQQIQLDYKVSQYTHPLLACFLDNTTSPLSFIQTLEKNTPAEQETPALLDALVQTWAFDSSRQRDTAVILNAYNQLPMPGGSKIFWKNLYLNFSILHRSNKPLH